MTTHVLKTWPAPFAAVLDGTKRHEIRKADRPFAVGDVLELREWDPEIMGRGLRGGSHFEGTTRGYTGRSLTVRVTYITRGGEWGVPDGLCVMSIAPVGAP